MDSLKEMESISIRNVVGFFFAGLYAVCAVFMKISYNVLFKFQNITKVYVSFACFFNWQLRILSIAALSALC